jgi:hypothetical protein
MQLPTIPALLLLLASPTLLQALPTSLPKSPAVVILGENESALSALLSALHLRRPTTTTTVAPKHSNCSGEDWEDEDAELLEEVARLHDGRRGWGYSSSREGLKL